jgi:hypothetical protein
MQVPPQSCEKETTWIDGREGDRKEQQQGEKSLRIILLGVSLSPSFLDVYTQSSEWSTVVL